MTNNQGSWFLDTAYYWLGNSTKAFESLWLHQLHSICRCKMSAAPERE